MKIAIDISPLKENNLLSHRVRGTGFYIENLKKSLLAYFSNNDYFFFTKGKKLPKDLNIVHFPYFEPFFLSLPYIKNCRNIVTVHDLTPLVFPRYFPVGIKGAIKWYFQKLALRKIHAIITDSQSSKDDIIKYADIPSEKIYVVYLAASANFKKVENSSILGSIRKKYRLPENFVLYVGDVTWNKNLPRLIKAIQKKNIPLVMVGKALVEKNFDRINPWNQDRLMVQKLAEEDDQIIRLGFVPTDDLVILYNLAKVFVMPSIYEGFGLPILEAMSCGCPVVTTKCGSIPEIAGNATYYVDAHNIEDISKGIQEVFLNEVIQSELSRKGLEQAKKFSWKKTVVDTIKVYEKTISSGN